jgi:hypothetical protein
MVLTVKMTIVCLENMKQYIYGNQNSRCYIKYLLLLCTATWLKAKEKVFLEINKRQNWKSEL